MVDGMTDFRLHPWGNPTLTPSPSSAVTLTTDDNTSMMEAFITSADPGSLWPPAMTVHPSNPSTTSPTFTGAGFGVGNMDSSSKSLPPSSSFFSPDTLQQRLQTLIESAVEYWTYAIFWQASEYGGPSLLGWGDGYYKGEEDKGKRKNSLSSSSPTSPAEQEHRKKVLRELNSLIAGPQGSSDDAVDEEVTDTEWFFLISMTQSFVNGSGLPGQALYDSSPVWVTGAERLASSHCERARQAQSFGLQTLVCIPSANGVVELGSTDLIFESSDMMNKVRLLFSFNNMEMGSGSGSGSWPVQPENDPSALWLIDPSSSAAGVKEGANNDNTNNNPTVQGNSVPCSTSNKQVLFGNASNPCTSTLTESPATIPHVHHNSPQQSGGHFTRELNFSEYGFEGSSVRNGTCKPESGEILNFGGESNRKGSNCSANGNLFSGQSQFGVGEENKNKKRSPVSRGSNDEGMLSFTSGVILPSSGGVVKCQMHGNAYSLDDESSASRQLCNKPNGCKVFGSVAPYGDAVLRVQGSANSMHHYQNNEQKQIIHGEVVDGGSLWKSNSHDSRIEKSPLVSAQVNKEGNTVLFDSTTLRTADRSSPFLPNSYQFNYLKNVDQFVKSKVGDGVKGPRHDSNNFSCKEEGKGHELENNDKQEYSNDSYRSILSHHTLAGGRKENVVADAVDSRTLSADKQKSSNQMDRKSATLRKFQYHPMGNMDDVEPTHGMKQPMYSQAISHFGQSKSLGQVPKNSIEMGKGQLPDAQRSTKGFDEVHSPGNVPGPIPNFSAPFGRFMDMDTPDKASQSSQNMLELLHKVDQSRERAVMMHVNAASETPQAENSDGSVGWLQRSQSSNSQGFGLQLGPPMQRLPVSNQSLSSQSSLQMVSSLHSTHAAPEIGQKGQVHVVTSSFVQSMPPSSERSRGEINRSGIPGPTDNEISVSKMPGNFSSTFNSGFHQLRGNLFGQEVAWAGGQLSRPLEKCGSHSTQKDDPHNRPLGSQSAETSSPDEAGSIPQGGNSVSSGAQKIGTNIGQVLAPQNLAGKVVPISQPSSVSGNSLQGAPKELQSNLAAQHLLGAQFREVSSHFSQSNQTNVANSTSASLNEFDQDGKRGNFQSEFANSQGFHSKEEQLTKASTGEQVSSENINFIQKINGSQGKELNVRTASDGSPASSVSTQRDIEAFGRSLKPNNFLQQNYSLLNQMLVMKNADDDPSNRALKRMKGLDSVGSPTVSPEVRQSNDLTAIVGGALVPHTTNSSLDPTMLRFSATENNVASNVSSQHGNIASQGVLAFSRDRSQSSSTAAYSEISPQMASSWFNQYGTLKNGQILPVYDALKAAIVKIGAQPHTLGKSSSTLPTPNSMEPLNAAAVESNGSIWRSATPSLAVEYFSSQILPSNATVQHPVLLRTNDASTKKRKSTTFELDPWHKEVLQGSRNLQSISMAEVEWAKSANRRIDKVETEVELLEDGPLMLQQKRRLILTTQLIQQLLLPPPAAILSMDANMDYESVVYYVSRLALGDACSVVSLTSNKSNMVDDRLNRCSDEIKTSGRVHDELLLKVIDNFMARARKLENEFLRLDKKASVLDLIVECQDLEKFSVINRFAKFHGRGQADSAEAASSADAAANTQKPHPQRYVTALPLPRNFPTSVQCCSL